jgi:hypothetical protein
MPSALWVMWARKRVKAPAMFFMQLLLLWLARA